MLALGFAGAFRRSELVALEVADLAETPDGLRVTIRHSKTDQEGQGAEIAISRGTRLRPVEAVRRGRRLRRSSPAAARSRALPVLWQISLAARL